MLKITALLSVLALAASTAAVSAAQFTLNPVVTAAFDTAFNPLPTVDFSFNGVARVFEVDLQVTTAGLAANERGFGNVGFNVQLTNFEEAGAGGYQPNLNTTDSNGAAPGGVVPLFSTNADAGPSSSDLQGIFVTIASGITNPNVSDARVKVGQPGGPNSLGKIYVKWDAMNFAHLAITNSQWSVYSTTGVFGPAPGFGGEVFLPGIDPEPASITIAGMGLIGLVAATRRGRGTA